MKKEKSNGNFAGMPKVRLYSLFGLKLTAKAGRSKSTIGECPFCGKNKFSVDGISGVYCCLSRSCGHKGNAYTWIRWCHKKFLDHTTNDHYLTLSKESGVSVDALERGRFAWSEALGRWFMPIESKSGNIVQLSCYRVGDKDKQLPGLEPYPYGLTKSGRLHQGNLSTMYQRKDRTLLLCDSVWDGLALDQRLSSTEKANQEYDVLVSDSVAFNYGGLKHLSGYNLVKVCFGNNNVAKKKCVQLVGILADKRPLRNVVALDWPEKYQRGCTIHSLAKQGIDVLDL